jgi:hypothetical protein
MAISLIRLHLSKATSLIRLLPPMVREVAIGGSSLIIEVAFDRSSLIGEVAIGGSSLIREVAFDGSSLIREVAIGGSSLIREVAFDGSSLR